MYLNVTLHFVIEKEVKEKYTCLKKYIKEKSIFFWNFKIFLKTFFQFTTMQSYLPLKVGTKLRKSIIKIPISHINLK